MPLSAAEFANMTEGIHGITVLKTYRDVNPHASILVLDKGASMGGVWATDRLYPGLRTNNHFRTFEYSDLPMSTEGYSLANDHVPGEHVNEYLHEYAHKYDLVKHMRFRHSVESASDEGASGWMLSVINESAEPRRAQQIKAARLVVATGLTSEPFMPKLSGRESFGAPIYHTSEFARESNGLGPYKNVALLSGAKFSWDIACAYASAGIHVDWIIRESGHGPCWMMPNRLTPLKVIPELLLTTRLLTWLSPCIWGEADGFAWIRDFFCQHWLGRKIVDAFFGKVQHSIEEHNNYDAHPETAKLKPWDDVFFIGTNRGLLNYGLDFFEFVRNGTINVHIADIDRLSDHTVHLSTGAAIEADILICGTGWKDAPPISFVSDRDLGLPGSVSPTTAPYISQAETEIFTKCPKLKDQPEPKHYKPLTNVKKDIIGEPYRLYRFIVAPAFIEDKTLAFAGAYRSPATTIIAQSQALWITAFFENGIHALQSFALPSMAKANSPLDLSNASQKVLYETVLHTQFGKWRYSRGFGARFPELWFDCLPYVDLLLGDVGVRNHRKGGWWAEMFTPYFPKDYANVVPEYLLKREQRPLKQHLGKNEKAEKVNGTGDLKEATVQVTGIESDAESDGNNVRMRYFVPVTA